MHANLYLAYTSCGDIVKHIEIDSADILGFDSDLFNQCCSDKLLNSIPGARKSVVVVPRRIVYVDSDSIDNCTRAPRSVLTGCIPRDTSSARRLAKIGKVLTVVLTTESSRFIDESQVSFMAQSAKPKYIEIHLHPFVSHMVSRSTERDRDLEKDFYILGNVAEYALKRDVGVIPVAASPILEEVLLTPHIDLVLYSLGFSKRERRLMLELYPLDLVQNWLKQ